jgi:hypothetical protein
MGKHMVRVQLVVRYVTEYGVNFPGYSGEEESKPAVNLFPRLGLGSLKLADYTKSIICGNTRMSSVASFNFSLTVEFYKESGI